jgi:hypothetical protein
MPQAWTCTYLDATTSNCTVTATSSADVGTTTVPYGDWLIVNSLILFCVAFVPISAFFALFSKRR